jgi:hypothetical protein
MSADAEPAIVDLPDAGDAQVGDEPVEAPQDEAGAEMADADASTLDHGGNLDADVTSGAPEAGSPSQDAQLASRDAEPPHDGAAEPPRPDGAVITCPPNCGSRTCGDDGCGGSCGQCTSPAQCDTRVGMCVATCTRQCTGKLCGPDGCGGSCGPCAANQACNAQGTQCACVPNCVGRACGDNGCGGVCGTCGAGTACNAQGVCACAPSCGGRNCGANGCGGTCGECGAGQSCSAAGVCAAPTRSFSAEVFPIFSSNACPICHDAVTPSAGLDLASAAAAYTSLVNKSTDSCSPNRLYVAPGSPDTSYLINKLTDVGICSGVRMPRNRPPLSAAQIDLVRAWIAAGAAP